MEESSGRTLMSRPREDPSEWKAKFTPDLRRKVVQKILDFIRMPPEARSQMTKVIEQFEEGLFRSAISQEDYLQKISRKLKLIDHKSSHSNAGVSSPSKPVRGQSSSLKNVYQAPSKVAGDSVGQGMQSNISADNQRNGLGTRQDQHQQSQQQLLTHNVHQPYAGNLCIEDILSVHCYQQQQNIASQSNSFQFSQNQTLNTESQQPPFSEQSSTAVFQPNQLVPQGNNIGQQLSPFQKTMPNSYQQPDGLQSNASCLQQQHRVTGAELKVMNMKSHEHSAHILQVEDTSLPLKVEQSVQSVNNFHQLLYSPKQSKKETTHQRPDTLAAMVTPRIVNNQQNVLPAVKNMTEVSSETGAPSEQANMAEFHDQMYQKFQAMRKEYLPWLTHVYNKLNEKCQKVQSLSPKTLSASVREIGSALKTVDAISGTACNDSGVDVDENLVSATTCCMHGRNFSLQSGCSSEAKMEDKTNPIALDETDSIKQSAGQIWDIDTSRIIKRRRVEPSNTLLDEIKCINQWLIETEIDLDSSEDPSALDAGEGTIVRCVYSAVALDENFKMQFASQILPLPLRLFVPASYPNASPVILGGLSFDWSGESIGSINLSEKTRSRFSLSLRKLSEPMSLAEMAMTWDICARTVLLEYAQSVDGGCFSSKYGKWENCVTA